MLIVIVLLGAFFIGLLYGFYQDIKEYQEKNADKIQYAKEQREIRRFQRQQKKTAKRHSKNSNLINATNNNHEVDNSDDAWVATETSRETTKTTVESIIKDLDYHIMSLDGHQFEYFCAELLKGNGFTNVKVTPGSGDQGVDILALKEGVKYAIQCKNYSSALGNTPIQEVNAGKIFYKCHVGVVMTNSTFTQGAIKLAEVTGILLWDGRYIHQLAKNNPSAIRQYFNLL